MYKQDGVVFYMSETFAKKKSKRKRLVSQAPLHGTSPLPFSTENLVHKEKRGNSWNKKHCLSNQI